MQNITTSKIVDCVNKIARNNKSISVKIEESKSTNSVYVTMYSGNVNSSFRISDHRVPSDRPIKNLIIKKSTTNDHVMRFITNCFDTFRYKVLMEALNNISKH